MKKEVSISISSDCIKCKKCVTVCPADVILSDPSTKNVYVDKVDQCIACGQCAAICPVGALHHSCFPDDKIHVFDPEACPSEDELMLLLKKRRSNRAFSRKPVPDEYLFKMIEAAHYFPSAHNSRDLGFTVIRSEEKLRLLTEFTVSVYDDILKKLRHPLVKPWLSRLKPDIYDNVPILSHVVSDYRSGKEPVLRNATAVILFHTQREDMFSNADANLAYQNASLMAETLGVGHFYMGYVCSAIRLKKGKLERLLGIDGHIQVAMAVGMPLFRFPNYIDRGKPVFKTI